MIAIRDRYLAPGLLSPFADDMARRLSRISMGPVLEICADTGVMTQAIASAMSVGLTIIATDPRSEALERAQIRPGMARIAWQLAEPHALPFPDATFGIATCHFWVATLPDRVRAFQESRRVMKAGGRFVFSVPAHIRYNPVAECVQSAMDAMFPSDPPNFIARTLHGYADNALIDDDLTAAGFTDAIYTTVELPYAAASASDVAVGYCFGTPLRDQIEARTHGDAERVIPIVAAALQKRFGPGPIETGMRAHIVSASG